MKKKQSMSRSVIEYFEHIRDELDYLERNSASLDFATFEADETLKRAFSRSLEIIGEASKSVPDDLRILYPEIEWRAMAGMRDKLIHHYFGIDYELLWDIIENGIGELNFQIKRIIEIEKQKMKE